MPAGFFRRVFFELINYAEAVPSGPEAQKILFEVLF